MHSTDIQWSAILSWGYADNILRLKSKQSEPPINFIQCSQLHQVNTGETSKISRTAAASPGARRPTVCTALPTGDQLCLGA